MLYFHYCKSFTSDVSLQIFETVKKACEEYSNRNSLKGAGKVSPFSGGLYVLLIKKVNTEVIIQEKKVRIKDKLETVCFVRAIKTGLSTYVEIKNGKWLVYNPLSAEEEERFIQNFSETLEEKTKKLSPPSALLNWQEDYKLLVTYDIYETEEWIKFALSHSFENGMKEDEIKLYGIVINEIIQVEATSTSNEVLYSGQNYTINSYISNSINNIGIIYSKITIDNKDVFLLINGGNTKTQKSHWDSLISRDYAQSIKDFEITQDSLSSIALKAYPSWTLKQSDLWARIEKNNEMGNLSLLPEQTTFLRDFKFPKYINGQAGSGKSTMLYYLFANAYYFKYADQIPGDIIFLTENENLLEHTKKSVYDLLLFNPEFELSSDDIAITNVAKHFYPFKTFLLNLLPDDNKDFSNEKYLDYSKFKYLYEQSNIPNHLKNRYSSELVWFYLSTYVYGYDLKYQITSNNYEEKMPKEGKELISIEDFSNIEKSIIIPFYNKLLDEEGYWDKIKLIKYINENVDLHKKYDVIFCDEAQDFSRVELNFILNLSEYTNYDLSNVNQFPIVFAGDALQTVNPTGFKTEVLTSMIYNELTDLGFKVKERVKELVFTPTFNYRSSQTIVNVANAIQLYRKVNLEASVKNPQISKRPVILENEHLNVFVDIDSFNSDINLQSKVSLKTIIIPTNRDEIDRYKNTYPVLNQYENIISAVDAKGIDFSEVVIFGFGQFFLESIKEGGGYEKQYFFNKLYVAVTRAQAELVIIDTISSKTDFWSPLINDYIASDWGKGSRTTLRNFSNIIIFDSNEIIQSQKNVIEDDARRQKEQGILSKNIALLQIASSHFIKIGKTNEYYLCLAAINEIKEDWTKAAEYYLNKSLGRDGIEKAAEVYWKGKQWKSLINISGSLKSDQQQIRYIIAQLFNDNNLEDNDLRFLLEKNLELNTILLNTKWKKELIGKLLDLFLESDDNEYSKLISTILEYITPQSEYESWKKIGEKYLRLKNFELSVNAFDKASYKGLFYTKAKLEIAKKKGDTKEIIFWLGNLLLEENIHDINEIFVQIVSYYESSKLTIADLNNEYTEMYIYISYLAINPNHVELLQLSKKVENAFKNKGIELAEYYKYLLEKQLLKRSIIDFVLQRWIKNSVEGGMLLQDINMEYELLLSSNNQQFEPFSEVEVQEIPELPDTLISDVYVDHLKNIQIQHFRQFKDIKVNDLGLFNLIVGDNNIGKTSFLESLLFTPDKQEYLKRLAFAYIERVNIHPDKDKNNSSTNTSLYYTLTKDFVCDFQNCASSQNNILFSLIEKRRKYSYEVIFNEEYESNRSDENLEVLFSKSDFTILENIPYMEGIKQPFMPYGKGYSSDLAHIYDTEIRPNRNRESDFLKNMKLFIPSINHIYASVDNSIDIRDDDFEEDRPLHQYGEGANKLFRILILLTIHKGKRLMIDEIDAGIHYTKFKSFWRLILEIAHRDNTQIFATTHNEECIKYFSEILENLGDVYQEKSRIVQMKMVKALKVRSFKFESFNLAIEDGVEIRGGSVL